jgi:hypothetical protein
LIRTIAKDLGYHGLQPAIGVEQVALANNQTIKPIHT